MVVYQQPTFAFQPAPDWPERSAEVYVHVSYAAVVALLARKSIFYVLRDPYLLPLKGVALIYQDLT